MLFLLFYLLQFRNNTFSKNINKNYVSEYLEIAESFHNIDEIKFINAILDKIYKEIHDEDRESQIINKFFLPLAKNKESFGLSSDAALLNNNLVVSSDMMIEGTHFKKNHDPKN